MSAQRSKPKTEIAPRSQGFLDVPGCKSDAPKPRVILLTQGKYALVDDEDFERVRKFKWVYHESNHTGYAYHYYRVGKKKRVLSMHRLLMDTPKGMTVDHRDHDGPNNQKRNLRICTRANNTRNMRPRPGKRFKGIGASGSSLNPYTAFISVENRSIRLGYFNTEEAAAKAYDEAALRHFGEFACLNFPQEIAEAIERAA